MCGIAGIFRLSLPGYSDLGGMVQRMTDSLRHRGPDDAGQVQFFSQASPLPLGEADTPASVWESAFPWSPRPHRASSEAPVLVLGHRRLSILDLSAAGHQPMASHDGALWVVFNGEIYNYLEIRAELTSLGVSFQTATDTEVILEAYRQWGTDCAHRFNGMWAFALYDGRSRSLWCCRDRTGVKPFYYALPDGMFAFASEQKALLTLPGLDARLNIEAVADYFLFSRLDQSAEGLFKGIFELPAGHELMIAENGPRPLSPQAWYRRPALAGLGKWRPRNFAEHAGALRAALQRSVELRLRADVPVGACLSGGLDSSSLVCLMHAIRVHQGQGGEGLHVFTAGAREERFDERKWAAIVVERTGATWHQTIPEADELRRDLETMMYAQDAPTFSARTYTQFRVMELVHRAGIKVVLDGQGGDELLSGYEPHDAAFAFGMLKNGRVGAWCREARMGGGLRPALSLMGRMAVKNLLLPGLPEGLRWKLLLQKYPEWQFLSPDLLAVGRRRLSEIEEAPVGSLAAMLSHEYFGGPLQHLLRCEDRAGMWHSIESRTPFADDPDLMELVFTIPDVFKIHGGYRKALLREAMRGLLPEAIRTRRDKMGFVAPNNDWLQALSPLAESYFAGEDEAVFNKKALLSDRGRRFWIPDSPVENFRVYKFMAFSAWRKRFGVEGR
jgi:asparagine synthase (glutamine-hydrolysing)